MGMNLRLGRKGGSRSEVQGEGCMGLALAAFGGVIAWAGASDYGLASALFLIGATVVLMGLWLILGRRFFPRIDPFRVLGGVLCTAAGLACGSVSVAVVLGGNWRGLGILLFAALWFLGAVMSFDLQHKLLRQLRSRDRSDQVLGGAVALLGGVTISFIATGGHDTSGGGSPGLGLAAGGVFVLAGVLLLGNALGWLASAGLFSRLLVAALLTVFTVIAAIFPPGALFVAVFAASAWINVYRWGHERVTGRDPMARLTEPQQLGVAAAVVVFLGLAVLGVHWARKALVPEETTPLEVEATVPSERAVAGEPAQGAAGAPTAADLPLEAPPQPLEAPPPRPKGQ